MTDKDPAEEGQSKIVQTAFDTGWALGKADMAARILKKTTRAAIQSASQVDSRDIVVRFDELKRIIEEESR